MKTIYILLCVILIKTTVQSQTWQWGKSGGASDAFDSFNEEEIKSSCVDIFGNVYFISDVGRTSLQVAGNPKQTYAEFARNDGILSSFGCDGSYRWSKVIGGSRGAYVNRIGTDGLGNVYMVGQVRRVTPLEVQVHFDTDVILPSSETNQNTNKETIFIIKYNSEGVFQWLRMPEAADVTLSQISNAAAIDIQVDPQGNCFWLCYLPLGVYGNGAYTVTTASYHVLQYDAAGNFTGGFPIGIVQSESVTFLRMKRNHNTGDIYIAGDASQQPFYPLVYINGELFTRSVYLAAFSSTGAFLWKKENQSGNHSGTGFSFEVDVDAENNIYFATTLNYNIVGEDFLRDSFNGVPVSMGDYETPVPVLVKLDPNGNTIWQTNGNIAQIYDLKVNGNEVAVGGSIGNFSVWDNMSDVIPTSNSPRPFLARFNKDTGAIIGIHSISSPNGVGQGTALAVDSKGNYYLGGKYESKIIVAGETLIKTGGDTDFFMAKFGTSDCTFLGTNQQEQKRIKMYPNPVKNILHLEDIKNSTYILYDVLGASIAQGIITANGIIDLSGISRGVYVLALLDDTGERTVVKVVKE